MRNTLEKINSRLEDAEQISDLEDRIVESTQDKQQKKKKKGASGTISSVLTFTL